MIYGWLGKFVSLSGICYCSEAVWWGVWRFRNFVEILMEYNLLCTFFSWAWNLLFSEFLDWSSSGTCLRFGRLYNSIYQLEGWSIVSVWLQLLTAEKQKWNLLKNIVRNRCASVVTNVPLYFMTQIWLWLMLVFLGHCIFKILMVFPIEFAQPRCWKFMSTIFVDFQFSCFFYLIFWCVKCCIPN